MSFVSAIGILTESIPYGAVYFVSYLLSALLSGYPAAMYLLMLINHNDGSRKRYGEAFWLIVKITNVLLALVAIFVLTLSVYGFFFTYGSLLVLVTGIASLLGFVFMIFLNLHLGWVVQTYAKHGEGDGNYNVYY